MCFTEFTKNLMKKHEEDTIFICSLLRPTDLYWPSLTGGNRIYDVKPSLCYSDDKVFDCQYRKTKISRDNINIRKRYHSRWKNDEIDLLIKLCHSKINRKWKKISEIIGTKTKFQCLYKFNKLKKSGRLKADKFEEDVLISSKSVRNYFSKKNSKILNVADANFHETSLKNNSLESEGLKLNYLLKNSESEISNKYLEILNKHNIGMKLIIND